MLRNQILLTPKQQSVVDAAKDWYFNSSEQVFQFAGNPGTGKSVTLNAIIASLGLEEDEVLPMAYVGAAAINMRLKGLRNARTIHSSIYDMVEVPVRNSMGQIVMNKYFNRPEVRFKTQLKDLSNYKLLVIDEGGTVPLNMKNDILHSGKKVIVAGDLDQLSPVADAPAFLTSGKIYVLDEIMRQASHSAIIYLCQRVKRGLPIHTGVYGNEVIVMEEKDFKEIAPIVLPNTGVVLCAKNETRSKYTDYIRTEILGKHTKTPDMGEKLICRMNDWRMESGGINLTNGLTGRVMNQPDVSTFDGECFKIDFMPDLTNIPFISIPVDYEFFTASLDKRKDMKAYNYLKGEAFEFGYVQTVHLAQGSQWRTGVYFEEFLPQDNNKLHYTALSRFSSKCIYVKKNRKYW